jgi:citrate/tricarballylate utilization protein
MLSGELLREGEHVMTVCNACRYCEAYCAMFPAMENRLTFTKGDLSYLANVCHNCGECLYACQYAPPHEFAINVPRTLATIRLESYEEHCWPRPLAAAFRRNSLLTAASLAFAMMVVMFGATRAVGGQLSKAEPAGDFYGVLPHQVMIAMFGAVGLFVAAALVVGVLRFWRDVASAHSTTPSAGALAGALRDALTLRYLQGDGEDCTAAEERRTPWRRVFHHFTLYGFLLCFASTSVAALYHVGFGWIAPYGYTSVPVVLGTLGGIGLLIGPTGLMALKQRRDPALGDPIQDGMDVSLIALLVLTSLTGLVLLVLRDQRFMGSLLIVHLGLVLALFLTLPYGKFVHGFYRTAALLKYRLEDSAGTAQNL